MANRHRKIGITGGIGAGKTTVCRIFEVLGIPVYDADSRAKWLMNSDPSLRTAIKELFGENAYKEGVLNRAYLSRMAFSRPALLEKLNKLVHPRVGSDYEDWVEENDQAPYTLKEAALLFESGSYKNLDKVILVSAPEDIRIQRVRRRDPHRNEEDIRKIIARQWNEEEKLRLADFIVNNCETELVVPQALKIHSILSDKV